MKIKQLVFVALLFAKQAIWGCYIVVDPTYDFAFKALFGSTGFNGKENRLKSLINSILEPYLNITVKELKYKNVESSDSSGKNMVFDILTQCQCTEDGKGEFIIDIEMQRKKNDAYLVRTNMYGARLLDASSQFGSGYQDQIKNIVISIIDDELDEMKNVVVFAVRPYIETVFSCGETKIENVSQLTDPCSIQIYIQLPALCRAIRAFQEEKIRSNCWLENEWLKLLGSRRLCLGPTVSYAKSGVYDISTQRYENEEVNNAIAVLNRLSGDIETYKMQIIRDNRNIQEYLDTQKQNETMKEQLAQARAEIAQKDEKLTRTQQVKELRKQVKEYKKGSKEKKPRRSELPKNLKKLSKDAIKQYVKEEDDSISELDSFLDKMEED